MNNKQFHNKTIIISGAGSGIGRETAKLLAKSEASLILLGRNKDKLQETKEIIVESRKDSVVSIFRCDISQEKSIEECFSKIKKDYTQVYGLVNNAAINPSRESITKTNFEDWKNTLETNLSGTYLLTKKILPFMTKEKKGSIVNVSSIAGFQGMKDRFSYSVTKSALLGFSKSVSADYARHNIRSNCVSPGYINTPLTQEMLESLSEEAYEDLLSKHPLGLGKEHYVAEVIKFLLSTKSQWITGVNIPVDGGYSLGRD